MPGSLWTPTVSSSMPRREGAQFFFSVWQDCSPSLYPGGLSAGKTQTVPHMGEEPTTHTKDDRDKDSTPLLFLVDVWDLTCWPDAGWSRISPVSYLRHLPPDIKLRSREFITNQPLTLFHKPPPPKPRSNCLHPVIRQINGRAWNVAFTSTKVKCCREGVAFRLWLVDYAPRNPLNASIIWWSCQFAVCALSLPQSSFLLPPRTKADFAAWLLRRIWSLERRRYMLEGGTRRHRSCLGSSPPPSLRSEC